MSTSVTKGTTEITYPYPPYSFIYNVDSPPPHIEGWRSTSTPTTQNLGTIVTQDVNLLNEDIALRRDSVDGVDDDHGLNERVRLLNRISRGIDQLERF